jgi:hypothetical protein
MESDQKDSAKNDDSDAIFSLTSASLVIEEKLGLQFSGTASLCVKIINGTHFRNTIKDCTDLLNVSKEEFKFDFKIIIDSYNYLWIIINAKDLAINSDEIINVAATLSSTGDIIEENGFSEQIFSVIFKFKFLDNNSDSQKSSTDTLNLSVEKETNDRTSVEEGKEGKNQENSNSNRYAISTKNNNYNNNKNLFLIYNYKTNNFYPYIPLDDNQRDTSKELQVISILKSLISIENDFSKWFPIKDIPF